MSTVEAPETLEGWYVQHDVYTVVSRSGVLWHRHSALLLSRRALPGVQRMRRQRKGVARSSVS